MYSYTKNNLLEYPEKYFYSKYQGVEFLKSYISNRRDILTFVHKKLEQSNTSLKTLDNWIKNTFLIDTQKTGKNEKEIETHTFIVKIITARDLSVHTDAINTLIKKFEVSKKIYSTYNLPEFKGSGNNKDLILYILFALALAKFYKDSKKLFYLNAFIKTSDILCSQAEINDINELQGIGILINEELTLIEGLIPKKYAL